MVKIETLINEGKISRIKNTNEMVKYLKFLII